MTTETHILFLEETDDPVDVSSGADGRQEKCKEYIRKGYTASTIAELLGYKNANPIYRVAKKNGLSIKSPSELRKEEFLFLRDFGFTIHEIAGSDANFDRVSRILREAGAGLGSRAQDFETRVCAECGQAFQALKRSGWKYCSAECERVSNRRPKPQSDREALRLLEDVQGFEYAGEYTGSDGYIKIRCKTCGETTQRACVSIRHNKAIRCEHCLKKEREENKKAMERAREAEAFRKRKVMKYYQTPLRECAICGALFYPGQRKTYCSDACSRKSVNRYYTERKRKKGRAARTTESKYISVESLFRRDGGVCQICGEPCDITAEPNADLYPSVDHIIPLAHGGLDRLDNVRLAHRICNSRRGDRYTPSQGIS